MSKRAKTVVKRNDLVNASYRLTIAEQRLLLACISQIDSRKAVEPGTTFEVTAAEILDLVSADRETRAAWRDLKSGTERLFGRHILFRHSETDYGKVRWVDRIRFFDSEGRIELRFSPDILRYLSNLKSEFTQYKLQYVSKFRSSYSIRIYELLVQWLSEGEREIKVTELRETLDLGDAYPSVTELKRNVIEPALRDINEFSNLRVEYGQKKRGRRIDAFQFRFSVRRQQQKALSKQGAKGGFDGSDARPGETWEQYRKRKQEERKSLL
jgi:plasmid replication initiation protein